MKRLEIHISYACSNNCIFCSEKNRLQRFKDFKVNFNELENLLIAKRKEGFNHVNFTGGEPTLYQDFNKLLELTKALGYKIYIGSNGSFWAEKENCEKLLPLVDEISLSLHGADLQTHNSHTTNEESFNKIMRAFANIDAYCQKNNQPYFLANTVITNYNFDQVNKILELLSAFKGLKQILISNVAPEGQAFRDYQSLAVNYGKFKAKIPDWIRLAEQNNLIIRFFGLPLCVLSENYIKSNDLNYDERVTYELGKLGQDIKLKAKETDLSRRRIKIKNCDECQMAKLCGGIFEKYLEIFGEKEIVSFK